MPSGKPGKRSANCHPDRPHQARGLCASCYQTAWKAENPERFASRPRRPATCHPDKFVLARDLCSSCYRRLYRSDAGHREHERVYAREWQRERAGRMSARDKFSRHLRRYGLTFAGYSALILDQLGLCAACNLAAPDLEVDHCHETGRVRGLLCRNCNSALGHARDDVDRLHALIRYLTRVSA